MKKAVEETEETFEKGKVAEDFDERRKIILYEFNPMEEANLNILIAFDYENLFYEIR